MPSSLNIATRRYYNRPRLRLVLWLLTLFALTGTVIGTICAFSLQDQTDLIIRAQDALQQRLTTVPNTSDKEQRLLAERITALNRILARRSRSPRELLDLLEQVTPNGIVYTTIAPEAAMKNAAKLEGRAQNMPALSLLLQKLESTRELPLPYLLSTDEYPAGAGQDPSAGIGFVIALGGKPS
jgi:Tfp pilus assembly protein PilN